MRHNSIVLLASVFICVGCAEGGETLPDYGIPDSVDWNDGPEYWWDITEVPVDFLDIDAWFDVDGELPDTIGPDTPVDGDGETSDSTDLEPEDLVEDIPVDLGPGECTPDDFARQLLCNPGFKCTLGPATGCTATGLCDGPGGQGDNDICAASGESDNCEAGYVCLGDGVDSRCRKFCDTNLDCHSGNSGCIVGITTPTCTAGLTGVDVCTHNCDYFLQSGCQAGQACRFTVPEGESVAYSDCTPAGSGTQGSNCDGGSNDCAAGYDCFLVDEVSNECLKICRYPSGSPSCGAGTSCAQGTGWPTGIGACI